MLPSAAKLLPKSLERVSYDFKQLIVPRQITLTSRSRPNGTRVLTSVLTCLLSVSLCPNVYSYAILRILEF
mgnify:CR=1 FL=1